MKAKRVTITIDWDIYEWAVMEAARKKMSLAQELRWILRDGTAHRQHLEAQYRALETEALKYGR
jgi:hypothetical protein